MAGNCSCDPINDRPQSADQVSTSNFATFRVHPTEDPITSKKELFYFVICRDDKSIHYTAKANMLEQVEH